jgi:hypothetical protein
MTQTPSHAYPISPWLKWYLPAAIIFYPALLIIPELNWEANLKNEYGMMETLTNIFLLLSFAFGAHAALLAKDHIQRGWCTLFALGCFVFLGEEMSWGQHYMNWSPNESWSEINRQHETNIHNLKGWPEFFFTKLARNALSIGMILGSVVAPWWLRKNPGLCLQGTFNYWLWPSVQSAPLAILTNIFTIPTRAAKSFDVEISWLYYGPSAGELKECLIALFILNYALTLQQMAKTSNRSS